jgi:tetratricopeptide (TPR) repeat protein
MLRRSAFQPKIDSQAEIGFSLDFLLRPAAKAAAGTPSCQAPSAGPAQKTLVFALVFALASCAVVSNPAPSPSEVALAQDDASKAKPVYPAHKLDDATLYQLVMAEIASQRGMPELAFNAEYAVAKETRDPRLARRATEFALMAHQAEEAMEGARLWVEIEPNSDEARGTLLSVLVAAGRLDEAEPVLSAMLASSTNPGLVLEQIGQTLSRSPSHKEALALLERLAVPYQALPDAHIALAQAAFAGGDVDKAVAEARTAARLDANDETAPVLVATYLQAKDPAGASFALEEYLRRHPKSVTVRLAYARFLVGQRRYDDSGAQFRLILADRPHDADTLYSLGLLAYQSQRLPEAEDYFHRFIAVRAADPEPADEDDEEQPVLSSRSADAGYLYLAQIAEDEKDYPKALEALSHVSDGDQAFAAELQRATVLARMGRLEEARHDLHELPVQSQHERVEVILTEVQLLTDANRAEEALAVVTAGLQKFPDDADLLYGQGMTAEKLDRLDLMETSLRTLMRLHPENAQAYNALGYSWADRNVHLNEALDLIEKALALAPDDASIIDSLGWVQYRLGNTQASLENLMRAYKLRGDAEIAVHLGEVLWVSGRHADAERYWKEAEHKEPDNQVLHATLERFNVRIGEL